ncbi:MAG: glycosyltransferase family 4 protein [Candidatus Gygaella obscura]|nr:glycosyltransferase family 4 protein [Candidatus Gygaella obscura]
MGENTIKRKKCFIIANWMQGNALSGGDRIFIELSRRLKEKFDVSLLISKDGWQICRREGIGDLNHKIWADDKFNKYGYLISYFYRTLNSIVYSLKIKLEKDDIVYSSSDFLPDSIPAFILKFRYNIKWVAGFYLFAPKPWAKESPYKSCKFFTGLIYWLNQLPVYWLVKKFADIIFVTSEPDIDKFITRKRKRNEVVVIKGGVDISPSENFFQTEKPIPYNEREFGACFVGRLHYQKGVLEMVDIWNLVCKKKPEARLVVIGIGPLESEVKKKINMLELDKNIELVGFKNGEEKFKIFKQSKIVVHPATYDSGGMAAVEAMAWKLPGVSFDLEALKTYYPKGMLKVKCFDIEDFAKNILLLLNDAELYEKVSKDAYDWAKEWDWNKLLHRLEDNFNCLCK